MNRLLPKTSVRRPKRTRHPRGPSRRSGHGTPLSTRCSRALVSLLLAAVPALGCAGADERVATSEAAITSEVARILEFSFAGEVIGRSDAPARKAIVSQLMYVQGTLTTARHGNGQIRNVKLTNVRETDQGDTKRITYEASLPVAWPESLEAPTRYQLTLPLDVTNLDGFDDKYDRRCGRRVHGKRTFWHDFDPSARRCVFDEADVARSEVSVTPHPGETKRQYPEYDLLWADDRLNVVAIFGIIESVKRGDYGYSEAEKFIKSAQEQLANARAKRNITSDSILLDATITGHAQFGGSVRDVKLDVFVVDRIEKTGPDFDARYDEVSEHADVILYNGHTESGEGIDVLARKGKVTPGHYQLVVLNGCQSFALMDETMTERRRVANGEGDPTGTKYLDVITNALPGYADTLATISSGVFRAALMSDTPKDYNELLREMPESNVAVVFGEEDNQFTPPQ